MIHAVGEGFDVAEKHRAGAAPAQLVPGAVDVQIFLGGFLALGDGGADFLAENFRAAAGERIEAGGLQFAQAFRATDFLASQARCRISMAVKHFNCSRAIQILATPATCPCNN